MGGVWGCTLTLTNIPFPLNAINPEHLLQFGIKAMQDLAESSHYLYVSIKAYDFQCIPPHDNVQGGVSFSFQPGIAKNGTSYARVLILENWMRKIEWYEHEYGQLVDQTEELLRESLEKAWIKLVMRDIGITSPGQIWAGIG